LALGEAVRDALLCAPRFFLNNLLCVLSGFTHYDYPGIYQYQDFHHCGVQPGDNIKNYKNVTEVWTCQLSGLAEYLFSFYILSFYSDRAKAWQQKRNMFASGLQITRMTLSP
jgi:hypothetical protein